SSAMSRSSPPASESRRDAGSNSPRWTARMAFAQSRIAARDFGSARSRAAYFVARYSWAALPTAWRSDTVLILRHGLLRGLWPATARRLSAELAAHTARALRRALEHRSYWDMESALSVTIGIETVKQEGGGSLAPIEPENAPI